MKFKALLREIFRKAHIAGPGVTFHAFEPRDAGHDRGDIAVRIAGCALGRHNLDEFVHRETARVMAGALRRQDMIGA